jgi:hypothetical protein
MENDLIKRKIFDQVIEQVKDDKLNFNTETFFNLGGRLKHISDPSFLFGDLSPETLK